MRDIFLHIQHIQRVYYCRIHIQVEETEITLSGRLITVLTKSVSCDTFNDDSDLVMDKIWIYFTKSTPDGTALGSGILTVKYSN